MEVAQLIARIYVAPEGVSLQVGGGDWIHLPKTTVTAIYKPDEARQYIQFYGKAARYQPGIAESG